MGEFFSPANGLYVLFGREKSDVALFLFDVKTGKLLCKLPRELTHVWVEFSQDEKLIAFRERYTGVIHVVFTTNGTTLPTLGTPQEDPTSFIAPLAFSPNAKVLAAWDSELRAVVLWVDAKRKEMCRLPAFSCGRLVWSPDGRMLVGSGTYA